MKEKIWHPFLPYFLTIILHTLPDKQEFLGSFLKRKSLNLIFLFIQRKKLAQNTLPPSLPFLHPKPSFFPNMASPHPPPQNGAFFLLLLLVLLLLSCYATLPHHTVLSRWKGRGGRKEACCFFSFLWGRERRKKMSARPKTRRLFSWLPGEKAGGGGGGGGGGRVFSSRGRQKLKVDGLKQKQNFSFYVFFIFYFCYVRTPTWPSALLLRFTFLRQKCLVFFLKKRKKEKDCLYVYLTHVLVSFLLLKKNP